MLCASTELDSVSITVVVSVMVVSGTVVWLTVGELYEEPLKAMPQPIKRIMTMTIRMGMKILLFFIILITPILDLVILPEVDF